MKDPYILQAEPGKFEIQGGEARGYLAAGYTGRRIDVEKGYAAAKKWAHEYEDSETACPESEAALLTSLEGCAWSPAATTVLRGRFFQGTPASAQEFGPPPAEDAQLGRYNCQGKPALYLCSSEQGVVRELGQPRAGWQLWAQRYRLLPEYKLLDLRELTDDAFSAAVFWIIESSRDRQRPPLRLGCRVATLLEASYDGMIVPGVRGDKDYRYWNVVIFNPVQRWLGLLDETEQPMQLA